MPRPRLHQIASVSNVKSLAFLLSPLTQFLLSAAAGAIALVVLCDTLFSIGLKNDVSVLVGVSIYITAIALASVRLQAEYPHNSIGLCNVVTLMRLVIVCILIVVATKSLNPNWITFAIATLALCLDGVDGWLARKQSLSSNFGARFDVEVDALFALVLAIYAATNGAAGPAVILLGIPYYLFWLAKTILPWLDQDLPQSFARKVVCVVQIAVLIMLQVPALANERLDFLIGLVALALIWSFGRDIIWMRQNR